MLELGSTLQRRVMILTWSASETLRASKPTDMGLQERWRGGSVRHSYLHIRLIFAVAGLTLFSPSPAWALLRSAFSFLLLSSQHRQRRFCILESLSMLIN